MKLSQSSTLKQTSNYEERLIKPNAPSPEMVKRAQPFRADTLQELEAVIKHPTVVIYD
jgi:hypothetical protein